MDLAALQLKINNYITVVSSWVRNVGKLYFSSTPEDVTVQLIDDNGNVVDTTLPNVAQFRKRVWDDVGGAIGQFDKTFYVNQETGDDSNSGSISSPFKTLGKAIDKTPVSGRATIHIIGSYTETNPNVYYTLKNIGVIVSDSFFVEAYADGDYAKYPQLRTSEKGRIKFYFYDSDPESTTPPQLILKNTTGKDLVSGYNGYINIGSVAGFTEVHFSFRSKPNEDIIRVEDGYLLTTYSGSSDKYNHLLLGIAGYYDGHIRFFTGTKIANLYYLGVITFLNKLNGVDLIDENDDVVDIKTLFDGVSLDTDSGNPINLLSNINFSS